MDWQLLAVGVLVSLAVAYLGRRMLRAWIGHGAGCGGCKCGDTAKTPAEEGTSASLIPVEQVRLRRRGEAKPNDAEIR